MSKSIRIFAKKLYDMKRIALFIAMALCALSLQAQHLEFKGHQITGKLEDFVRLLEKDGWVLRGKQSKEMLDIYKKKHLYILDGIFLDKDVKVSVSGSITDTVYQVMVSFDCTGSWNLLISNYEFLMNALTLKYGKPTETEWNVDERFKNLEMIALSHEAISVSSLFKVDNGAVFLTIHNCKDDIDRGKISEGNIIISYIDDLGLEARDRAKRNMYLNDL